MANYKKASCTGKSLKLSGGSFDLVIYERICGWGFCEIYNKEGKLLAVLDHFGELKLRDQDIPMRLEAETYEETENGFVFNVTTTLPYKKLIGTSFEGWVGYPFESPVLHGTVTVETDREKRISIKTSLYSEKNVYAEYLRLLWLYVGQDSFGAEKTDALFPGIDWPVGKEWSSGMDFFKDPWANRCIPHPNKVASPVLAVSHNGDAVSVEYDLDTPVTRWFGYNEYYSQPVFAAPNFIERKENSLLGIMIPDVKTEADENQPYAKTPIEIHKGQVFEFSAKILVTKGKCIDALSEYVKRNGLPKPEPKYSPDEALTKIANAFNTNLWHGEDGFGYTQGHSRSLSRRVPGFLHRYVKEHPDTELSKQISEKIKLLAPPPAPEKSAEERKTAEIKRGEQILSWQKEDGSFRFEPDGRHYSKDDFRVARAFIEPMGYDGDTALYMNTTAALDLMSVYEQTGEERFAEAAKRALDFCADMFRPEGGDFWETPLHAPNLLAAGVSVNAYYYAYRLFGVEAYREKAVWYLRTLLAFTHLRRPKNVNSLYNTKPCLCCSDWYFANWVRDFVQWEVLHSISQAASLGIRWEKIDPEIDWLTYIEGVVTAAYNWMADHTKDNWRPHNIPSSLEHFRAGEYDCCFSDTFNSVTGNIAGMVISPEAIANGIYYFLSK